MKPRCQFFPKQRSWAAHLFSRYWPAYLTAVLVFSILPLLGHAQTITEFSAGAPRVSDEFGPTGITAGPDGNLWFTKYNENQIVKISPSGNITSFKIGNSSGFKPYFIAVGADGNLWFTENSPNQIGKIDKLGIVTQYADGVTRTGNITGIAAGSDGNIWFVNFQNLVISKIDTNGHVTNFNNSAQPDGFLTAGSDGNIWFSDSGWIAKITPGGIVTEYSVGQFRGQIDPGAMTAGPDGNIWFVAQNVNTIGKVALDGLVTYYTAGITTGARLSGITAGPDGALWFTERTGYADGDPLVSKIGRITTDGAVTEFSSGIGPGTVSGTTGPGLQDTVANPFSIVTGPDGNLWFTEESGEAGIGRVALSTGSASLVAAVLPGGRSFQVGATATVFATMLNAGDTTLTGCRIEPLPPAPAALLTNFQTTDPATNALTGLPNQSVSIPPNGSQTFVLQFGAFAPFQANGTKLLFRCDNALPAPTTPGVNTVDLLASTTPVPDVIALSATTSGDGIVTVPFSKGQSAAFAVASVNVGTAGQLSASADTGGASLPLSVTVCQSDPATAQCLAPPAPSTNVSFAANATPTFSIFVSANKPVAFAPGTARIFLRFSDSSGISHGSTSVAVKTN